MKKIIPIVLGVAFAILAWVRLVVQNSDLLYEAQDQGFWQPGSLYFQQVLQQPGSWLSWAGQYLTQFFFYPAWGASILILLWLVIYALSLYAWRLPWYLCWVALVIPMMLLWAETSGGYHIYLSKVPDWWFTPTLFFVLVAIVMAVGHWLSVPWRAAWQVVCLGTAFFLSHQWMQESQVPAPMQVPFHATLDDANFRAEMRMERAAERAAWSEVLTEMRAAGSTPTRAMWLYKNIALLNQNRLSTSWLDYPCLTQLPAFQDSVLVPLVYSQGPMIYFLHGSIEFSYRWSMENMVEFGPSMKRLRMMTRCALVKGEWMLAEKYLNLLLRTRFHRDWALQQWGYLRHPEKLEKDPFYSMAIQLSKARYNVLDGDSGKLESYIVNTYTEGGHMPCPALSELGLIYAMQSQNIQRFWKAFFDYASTLDNKDMPLLCQQAAYLFVKLEPQSAPRTDLPFSPEVSQTYNLFSQRATQLAQKGVKEADLSQAMQHEFGKTYYWFYYFCRSQKEY
ncbi:MAG: hypothetical protein J6X31_02950 [Bacteroidales bacterium]|nr:hypothetical protein [Bacteroidales bacterium]